MDPTGTLRVSLDTLTHLRIVQFLPDHIILQRIPSPLQPHRPGSQSFLPINQNNKDFFMFGFTNNLSMAKQPNFAGFILMNVIKANCFKLVYTRWTNNWRVEHPIWYKGKTIVCYYINVGPQLPQFQYMVL